MIYSIFPNEKSEKAISNYTTQLISYQKKQGLKVIPINYTAGDYTTLNLDMIKDGDIVHIQHEYNLLGNYGIPFFKLYEKLEKMDVKVVTTMHNVLSQNEEFSSGIMKTYLRKMLYRKQNKVIGKVSDIIIVHAKFFKRILAEEYGIPYDKIIVLPQGIQEDIKLIEKNKAKKELGLKGAVYLIIGSLIPDHGADIIIKQAKKIKGTILIVANSKAINDRNDDRVRNWLKHIKELTEKEGVKNVRFDIKNLPYDLWWKYFAASDVVLLPYKGGIGSGIFADCVATEKLMVGSNIKYFNEFAKEWDFIEVAKNEDDYAEKIEKILKEGSYSFKAYKERYGLTALAKRYKEIYK